MQLADEQGNKVPAAPLHVFSRTLDLIQAEQNRIRDTEGNGKPNAAIVVERTWRAYEASIFIGASAEDDELVTKLAALLQDPDFDEDRRQTIVKAISAYNPKTVKSSANGKSSSPVDRTSSVNGKALAAGKKRKAG